MGLQNNAFNKQKEIDSTKAMITQKKLMLQKFSSEMENSMKKKQENQQIIE